MPRCTHARGRLKNSIFIFIIAFLIGAFLLSHSLLLLALTHEEVVGKNGKTASLHATRKEGRKKKFSFSLFADDTGPLDIALLFFSNFDDFFHEQWCVTLYKIIANSIFDCQFNHWKQVEMCNFLSILNCRLVNSSVTIGHTTGLLYSIGLQPPKERNCC